MVLSVLKLSSSHDISKEKNKIGLVIAWLAAMFSIMLRANAVLPTDGRAASVKLHKYVTKSIGLSEWQKEDQR